MEAGSQQESKTVFWKTTETPRWQILALFVLTIVFNFTVEILSHSINSNSEKRQKSIELFLQTNSDFHIYATAFSMELLNRGEASFTTQQTLRENLVSQRQAMKKLPIDILKNKKALLEEYSKELKDVVNIIDSTKGIDSMKNFWEETSQLIAVQNEFSKNLNEKT